MTLDQLRIFIAVAEREHLTQAADALHLTPSAVSAAIHALETRYQVHLFDRVGRRIELSETGRMFLVEARATRQSALLAERLLIELSGLQRGSLKIQASQTIASYWLPPFVVAFKVVHPAIDIELKEGNSADVAAAVLKGTADLGFAEGDIEDGALTIVPVARDRLLVVGAPNHPLAKRKKVSPKDLIEATWVMREKGSGTRSVFESILIARGIDPAGLLTALELPTNEAACVAVRVGRHLTVVSELVARPHIAAGRLASIAIELDTRQFSLVRHKQRYPTNASNAFEALVRVSAPSMDQGPIEHDV